MSKPSASRTPSHAELADLLEQQLDSREPYSLRMTTGRAIVKALRESSTTTVVEILGHEGKVVSARCILSGCQDFAERICKCGVRVTPHRCQTGTEF